MSSPAAEAVQPKSRPTRGVSRAAPLRTVQPRARATRDALLAAGRALLQDRDFDALSIAELAGAIGLSVGSFYGRFRDKEAFFGHLQQQVTAEWLAQAREVIREHSDTQRTPRALIEDICTRLLDIYRSDAGFVRAALKHSSTHPSRWTPVTVVGQAFVTDVVALLAPKLVHLPATAREPRIRFAMQMLFGTGINAVLNDPGPLKLADPALARELARAMCAYLELDP